MNPGFTSSNGYFGKKVFTWNLPSGYTCPGALKCLTFADRLTGRITNGKAQEFRCYSATTERFPAVREKVWANFEAVNGKSCRDIFFKLQVLFPKKATHVRIHAGGDFFSQDYFDAWLYICKAWPEVKFWAFTKSLSFWVNRINEIPKNLTLQASFGGKEDELIKFYSLKFALVVNSPEEAKYLGLRIDTDDSLAAEGSESFALLENFKAKRKFKKEVA